MLSDRFERSVSTKHAITICVVVLMVMIAGCGGLSGSTSTSTTTPSGTTANGSTGGASPANATAPQTNYTRVYQQTIDSVVSIRSVGQSRRGSLGSGFIYRISNGTGYIVTNAHVVQRVSSVGVKFQRQGAWRTGTVIGRDVYTDLAVIKVTNPPSFADALPLATQQPTPGQKVVALGNPYGLTGTITNGLISAVNRTMPSGAGFPIPDTIQTGAPINPGNSGGPLVSLQGKVLGVNRATRQGAENIGFAISADIVRQVVPALINQSEYNHAYLGVRPRPVTQPIATANDLSTTRGVFVLAVNNGSPADGVLQPATGTEQIRGGEVPVGGDVIVEIENVTVSSRQALLSYLMLHTRPGETISLTIIRDGSRMTVQVTLGTRPSPSQAQRVVR
jgi:serine protease Do